MLERYAKRVVETRGMMHLIQLARLREYIRTTPIEYLIQEIGKLTDLNQLRALVEAGLRPPLLEAVLRRTNELMLRRRGL